MAAIENIGPLTPVTTNTLDGNFTEVTGAVSVSNPARTATGYLNLGGTFSSDYESLSVSAGFRFVW